MSYGGFRTDSSAFFQQKTRFFPRPAGPKWKFLEESGGFSASDGGKADGKIAGETVVPTNVKKGRHGVPVDARSIAYP